MKEKDLIAPLNAEIFAQLTEIPAFCRYLDTHYDIEISLDDDENYVGVTVGVVSMEETARRIAALEKADEPIIMSPSNKIITSL